MKRCFFFGAFFGPLKLRGSRCAELFQGKKPQVFVGKKHRKKAKVPVFVGSCYAAERVVCKLSYIGKNTSHLFFTELQEEKNNNIY